ncbi:hypothetical protein ES705_29338 [subsurface metagenome]
MKSSIVGQSPTRDEAIIIPLPCKSWDCPNCGPKKRHAWIYRLASGQPEREITLTCPVGKFLTPELAALKMKLAWGKLVLKIRKQWGPFEYALVWELTKKGVPHCHILCRGSYIAQKWLSKQWEKLGIGPIVYIKSVKGDKLHAAHACKYLAKSNGQTARILAPMRLVQVSGNYELPVPDAPKKDEYPDWVWVWDRDPSWLVARRFTEDPITTHVTKHVDGLYTVRMRPHPPEPDMLEIPAMWASWPHLAPIPDLFGD